MPLNLMCWISSQTFSIKGIVLESLFYIPEVQEFAINQWPLWVASHVSGLNFSFYIMAYSLLFYHDHVLSFFIWWAFVLFWLRDKARNPRGSALNNQSWWGSRDETFKFNEILECVNSLHPARVICWGEMISTPDAALPINSQLSDLAMPHQWMENGCNLNYNEWKPVNYMLAISYNRVS